MKNWAYSEALETQVATMRSAAQVRGAIERLESADSREIAKNVDSESVRSFLLGHARQAESLSRAQPMFWGRGPTDLVVAVLEQIQADTKASPDLLYCQEAWCWFERPISSSQLQVRFDDGANESIVAISWIWGAFGYDENDVEEGLAVTAWGVPGAWGKFLPIGVLESVFVKKDEPISIQHGAEEWVQAIGLPRFAIAAGAFLRTKLSGTEQHRAERHARKRIEKVSPWQGSDLIDVVMLRKRDSSQERSEEERFVDWQHQWIVRAHTRQQWYASKGIHLPIIVMPYIKGPEGKPLKAPPQSVFAVTR